MNVVKVAIFLSTVKVVSQLAKKEGFPKMDNLLMNQLEHTHQSMLFACWFFFHLLQSAYYFACFTNTLPPLSSATANMDDIDMGGGRPPTGRGRGRGQQGRGGGRGRGRLHFLLGMDSWMSSWDCICVGYFVGHVMLLLDMYSLSWWYWTIWIVFLMFDICMLDMNHVWICVKI